MKSVNVNSKVLKRSYAKHPEEFIVKLSALAKIFNLSRRTMMRRFRKADIKFVRAWNGTLVHKSDIPALALVFSRELRRGGAYAQLSLDKTGFVCYNAYRWLLEAGIVRAPHIQKLRAIAQHYDGLKEDRRQAIQVEISR